MAGSCLASFVNFDIFSKLQLNGSALLCYAMIISVQKLAQVIKSNVYYRLPKNTETQQERILVKDN